MQANTALHANFVEQHAEPEDRGKQNAVPISQNLHSFCNTPRYDCDHDNKTIFSQMQCWSQHRSGPAVDSAASVRVKASAQFVDQVYSTTAIARRRNRCRHTQRNEPVRIHSEGNRATTAS